MRTGLPYSMAASIMVRKLSSCFLPMLTLPGLMRYFASARAQAGIFLQQQMAVVVEVADDGHAHAELVQRVDDLRDGRRAASVLTVTRTSSEPACASAMTWLTVEVTSAVSVLVMDWTTMGCRRPPTRRRY